MTKEDLEFLCEQPQEVIDMTIVVLRELQTARRKHGPMASAHEGYAVIKEEMEELWDEIKRRDRSELHMAEECTQLGAMAFRFLIDVIRNGK